MQTYQSTHYDTDVVEFSSKYYSNIYYYSFNLTGYSSVDALYNEIVTKNIDEYTHEDNVTDVELGEPTI